MFKVLPCCLIAELWYARALPSIAIELSLQLRTLPCLCAVVYKLTQLPLGNGFWAHISKLCRKLFPAMLLGLVTGHGLALIRTCFVSMAMHVFSFILLNGL